MKTKQLIIMAIIVLAVGGGAFYGGMTYQKSQTPNRGNFANRTGGRFGAMGQNADPNTRPLTGDITSSDDKSVTVKLPDGSSKIVLYSASTKITKPGDATKEDLKSGTRVFVLGKTNSDGSVTADNIQVNFGQPNSNR